MGGEELNALSQMKKEWKLYLFGFSRLAYLFEDFSKNSIRTRRKGGRSLCVCVCVCVFEREKKRRLGMASVHCPLSGVYMLIYYFNQAVTVSFLFI